MKIDHYLFQRSPSTKRMFQIIVDFLLASLNNPELFEEIKKLAKESIEENPIKSNIRAYRHPDCPSKSLLYDYLFKVRKEQEFKFTQIDDLLDFLESKWIINKAITNPRSFGSLEDQQYTLNISYIQYLLDKNIFYCALLGFGQIIEHYKKSVYKIEVVKNATIGLGTGWIIDVKVHEKLIRVLVTNHHVVENASSLKVFNLDGAEVSYFEIESFIDEDVAFIRIDVDRDIPDFSLSLEEELLSEVITIGYPSIPLSNSAFQVIHRGEINAYIEDYKKNKLIIISARTAPGNSGSPVVNENGLVIGMVAEELFEKSAFTEKGITPYSACIPSSVINNLFNTSTIIREYFGESFDQ